MTTEDNQAGKTKELLRLGAEILGGGLTGAAAGFLIGGPAGSLVGGAVGPIVKRGFEEIAQRVLSHKEQIRISAATQFAIERYEAVLAEGVPPRTDIPIADKSAEELLEGILQKARNSYQEKKVRLIANIFADFAFLKGVSVDEAHTVLNVVEGVTYRQLVLLAVFEDPRRRTLRANDYRGGSGFTLNLLGILQDAYQLFLLGLLVNHPEGKEQSNYMLGWHDVTPATMKLTPLGKLVCALVGIDVIPETDKLPLIDSLRS